MAAIDLSTAGVSLSYASEATAGTRPTTGYIKVPGMKSTPDLNPAPETIETTTLDSLVYKTYVDGLKDMGGALEFTANLTEELISTWDTLMTAYITAKTSNKSIWFVIQHPNLAKGVYFKGNPSSMGLPSTEVGGVLETTLFITPTGEPVWEAKPTAA